MEKYLTATGAAAGFESLSGLGYNKSETVKDKPVSARLPPQL